MERIVLAYSGDLETSVAIPWLAEHYRAEVIAVTMDLGQGKQLEQVRDRALAALDDHTLQDIGLSRCDVEREVTKPFWRL